MNNNMFSVLEFANTFGVSRNFFSQAKDIKELEIIRVANKRPQIRISNRFASLLSIYQAVKINKKESNNFDETLRLSNRVLIGFWK